MGDAVRPTQSVWGSEAVARAAAGDLMAQRYLVAAALATRMDGEQITDDRVTEAETWARIAAARGDASDLLRLVHVLILRETMILQGRSRQPLAPVTVDILTRLAILCEVDDRGIVEVASSTLAGLSAGGSVSRDILVEVSAALKRGHHETPFFDGLVPHWCFYEPAPDDAQARSRCFETLAATLCEAHGVAPDAAALLITSAPGYAPELLDSKQGWDTISAIVAARLGEPPAIFSCN